MTLRKGRGRGMENMGLRLYVCQRPGWQIDQQQIVTTVSPNFLTTKSKDGSTSSLAFNKTLAKRQPSGRGSSPAEGTLHSPLLLAGQTDSTKSVEIPNWKWELSQPTWCNPTFSNTIPANLCCTKTKECRTHT